MKCVFSVSARLWQGAVVWLCALGMVMASSLPAFAEWVMPIDTIPPTTSDHPFIAVGTLHHTGPSTIEFRVQEAIKGKLSGTYQLVLRSLFMDPANWLENFPEGKRLVLFADYVVENNIFKNEKLLILPGFGWEPQAGRYADLKNEGLLALPGLWWEPQEGIYADLKVDAVAEAARGLVALEQAKSAEAAHAVFRKMLASPTPFVRYTACDAMTPRAIIDVLPSPYNHGQALTLAHALSLLNDPDESVRSCALRWSLMQNHSASIVTSIRLLNTTSFPRDIKHVYLDISIAYSQITKERLPDHLSIFGAPRKIPEWFTERAPELSTVFTAWWSKNSRRMLAEDGKKLIPTLESDNPVARWYAITLLTEMAGTDHGFDPDAKKKKRAAAVARWQAWLKELQAQAAAQTAG